MVVREHHHPIKLLFFQSFCGRWKKDDFATIYQKMTKTD
jgi:hypothetical protein